ncbi:MAG: CBS domain-containing protein [Rhodospirillales bacterium]|nr:CBS domain-containing protein [Rhodospirillales bacterium]
MSVKTILKGKTGDLVTCRSEHMMETVATLLTTHRIGALPVCDGGRKLVGIISERDIVGNMAKAGAGVMKMKVRDVMTKKVVVCGPEDSIKDVMELMDRRHIRHLPVLEDDKLVGIISQRDVMAHRLKETELETNVLRDHVRVGKAV